MGARSQNSLTKRTVDAAQPTDKRYHIWDNDLRGFGLRIEPSGIKTFVTKYRVNGGGRNAPQRIQTVGRYGVLTPDEARKKAKAILGSVATGADPAGDLAARRREMTIAALIDFYEKHGCMAIHASLIISASLWGAGPSPTDHAFEGQPLATIASARANSAGSTTMSDAAAFSSS